MKTFKSVFVDFNRDPSQSDLFVDANNEQVP